MRILAQHTQVVHVEVNPADVISQISREWRAKMPGEYINNRGFWESWEDTGHGSGLTTTHRKATDEEKKLATSLMTVSDYLRGK